MKHMDRCALSAQIVNFLAHSVTTQRRSVKVFSKLLPDRLTLQLLDDAFLNCTQYTTGTGQFSRCNDQATGLTVLGWNPVRGKTFISSPDLLWDLPSLLVNGYRVLVHGVKGRGVNLNIHFHLIQLLIMRRSLTPAQYGHGQRHLSYALGSENCIACRRRQSSPTPILKPHSRICVGCLKTNTKFRN